MVRATSKKAKSKQAPEPAGAWPVIGHLHMLGGKQPIMRKLGAMADKYGPAFTLWIGAHRTLVISGPDLVKECFTTKDKILATRPTSAAAKYLGYDYAGFGLSPYGPYWREIRKIVTLELLSNRRIDMLKKIWVVEIDRCIKELHGQWEKNHMNPIKVEMKEWFGDLTLNVVGMMVARKRYFGTAACLTDVEAARRFQKTMSELVYLVGVFVVSDVVPFLKGIDILGQERAMKRIGQEMDSILSSWLEEHRQRRRSGPTEGEHDFMDVMISCMDDAQLSSCYDPDTIIKATCETLIIAGSDTTSISLTWALSLLLNNRRVLKKAQDELDNHVGMDRDVDECDLNNLVYLQAVVKESLRLYSPAPLSVPHEAMEDCQIGNFHVPAGTRLLVNLWKLHRDPNVWSNPSEFQPERFIGGHANVDIKSQNLEYIPFGAGRRMCPGYSLALKIMHLTLARLLHEFDLTTPNDAPVDMTEELSLTLPKATQLEVLFTPRRSSKSSTYK
ncbi:xanthotoxin 5-hydroxylase CYP82C4-like [Magnolia sinica]|uniref:xanthotoxin 5-hydroxylase CYP82C4-like n=1 Tax=Magnolia sinica TaxID=86752 RepID=UPI00265B1F24|nr:xanthotoxin 5-hydroxylase CYP82C4-like [Magnolia sinica]